MAKCCDTCDAADAGLRLLARDKTLGRSLLVGLTLLLLGLPCEGDREDSDDADDGDDDRDDRNGEDDEDDD